jgi:hypothetical protein
MVTAYPEPGNQTLYCIAAVPAGRPAGPPRSTAWDAEGEGDAEGDGDELLVTGSWWVNYPEACEVRRRGGGDTPHTDVRFRLVSFTVGKP